MRVAFLHDEVVATGAFTLIETNGARVSCGRLPKAARLTRRTATAAHSWGDIEYGSCPCCVPVHVGDQPWNAHVALLVDEGLLITEERYQISLDNLAMSGQVRRLQQMA